MCCTLSSGRAPGEWQCVDVKSGSVDYGLMVLLLWCMVLCPKGGYLGLVVGNWASWWVSGPCGGHLGLVVRIWALWWISGPCGGYLGLVVGFWASCWVSGPHAGNIVTGIYDGAYLGKIVSSIVP